MISKTKINVINMDSKIQKYIVDYFTCLEKLYSQYKSVLSECHKITKKICTLVERQNRLKKVNIIDTSLEKFGNIEILVFNTNQQINLHISELERHRSDMEEMHLNLDRKKSNLENSCDQIDYSEKSILVNGSAFQPRLEDILEFAHDGTVFSLGLCAQIKYVISSINVNKSKCDFAKFYNESFKFDDASNKRIKEILVLTQFCNKNETL